MGRLIEAEKIREAIINYGTVHIENGVMQLDTVDTVVEIARLVDQIPTAGKGEEKSPPALQNNNSERSGNV